MICRVDGRVYRGRALRLSGVDPVPVVQAIRYGKRVTGAHTVSVVARRPHPVHERVGYVRSGMGLRVRTALAGAARARGLATRYDDRLAAARERLHDLETATAETTEQRRAVAEADEGTELRERVAELRGRLAVRREEGLPTDAVAQRLRAAARELSERETVAAAARQDLDRRRREARRERDDLNRRMALQDDVANLERRARRALVDRLHGAYAAAVRAVPGAAGAANGSEGGDGDDWDPFAVDPVTAALAVARVAEFDAPVVVGCDRFETPAAASSWLGAPAVSVET